MPFMLLATLFLSTRAQNPHILVNNADRQAVLDKIASQPWAAAIYDNLEKRVGPYVDRHITDPQWILSRYQMNRVPGKYYTTVISDNAGMRLVGWTGNAPNPTVRVSTYLRSPITEKGTPYRMPELSEVVPNDTARLMLLFNPEKGEKEWIDPQNFISGINGDINSLALDAAVLFWLKGDEKYARFAADILDQWARGAYYMEPVAGPCRTGFFDMQTLGDANYRPAVLAYDFVKPFMKQKGYDLHWYDTVFEKMALTLATRGFWNNNWYAAESSTMVFAALNLENKQKLDYYLQFILSKDTINGACGQLALPSTVEKWLTPDGHWKEPGGYHNYPVGSLLVSSLALEKNGYDVFRRFPALFKASYVMLKYAFPNLTVGGFGDTGRASQSPESLEIGILGATKYNDPVLPDLLASMNKLIEGGLYRRERAGLTGLLCYLPELPKTEKTYRWPRTGTLDFARYFLQRNGNDPMTGLMAGVQGATYNHNHCNGMAMELYGLGEVLGIDAGSGPNYEHPLHRNYFSQWAAHNTVVAAGSSSSVPFNGAAGSKDIGRISLVAMEPLPDQDAVSAGCSFTTTRYFDKSTGTSQSRTIALVRTSPASGYYADIYRSDNATSNDYVYHNIGDEVEFLDREGKNLATTPAEYPLTGNDYPGFRYFTEVRKLDGYVNNLTARFSIRNDSTRNLFMQVLLQGGENRSYFTAKSPKTKTSGKFYHDNTLPLFTIRTTREAKTQPFVAVFEPYQGKEGNSTIRVETDNQADPGNFTLLTVLHRNGSREEIFQSENPDKKYPGRNGSLTGYFGLAGYAGNKLTSLYLGKGREFSGSGYTLRCVEAEGSASLSVAGKKLTVNCNQPVDLVIPAGRFRKAVLQSGQETRTLNLTLLNREATIAVPAVHGGIITLE